MARDAHDKPAATPFDPQMVERALAGEATAFAALVDGHRRVATAVAYSILKERHLAADAVQEASLKAYQKIDTLRERERFPAWFVSIVRATALDLARRRERYGTREVSLGDREPAPSTHYPRASTNPRDRLEREEEGRRFWEALAELPDEYREVIILKHMEGRSYRDISRLIQVSVSAVESRLFRARQALHQALKRLEESGLNSRRVEAEGRANPLDARTAIESSAQARVRSHTQPLSQKNGARRDE